MPGSLRIRSTRIVFGVFTVGSYQHFTAVMIGLKGDVQVKLAVGSLIWVGKVTRIMSPSLAWIGIDGTIVKV